jgi:DNA-binding PadR family transcriptional regulator
MVKGASARENCPTDIKLALLEGPKHFEAFVKSLKGKYSRGTINKYLGELFKDGLVTCQGRRGPYELTPKGKKEAEREALKKKANTQIDNLGPEDIEFYKKKLDNLEKELKHYKRVARIRELELKLFPANIIQSKIKGLGINDDEFWRQSESIVWYWPGINHGVKSDDIILKLSREHLPPKLSDGDIDYSQGWKLLGYVPSKELYVYAIYKELLELYKEHLKETYTSFKNEYCLNDDEWKNLSPKIYEMIENGSFMREIHRYLFNYILSLNSIDKLKNLYMKQGISEKLAERMARETIEEAQHTKAEN